MKKYSDLNPKSYIPEAVLAHQLIKFLDMRISTYGLTTVKAAARYLGFTFDKSQQDFGKHHYMFGRIVQYVKHYSEEYEIPDRTLIIFTEDGRVACQTDRSITGIELMEIFRFPWREYLTPSIISLEKAYAKHHPQSQASKKHKG